MAITAFSLEAESELDLEQWLSRNGYAAKDDPNLDAMPASLRAKALEDVVCSACQVRGATLVGAGRQRGVGRNVSQGHFRFGVAGGSNPHHPLCDLYDDKEPRNTDYLVNFASDKSAQTRVIRDLVCRGIRARLFSQADIRAMRLWFLHERETHAIKLDVSSELLQWCVDMDSTRWLDEVAFRPEHGQLPGFDWNRASKSEWHRLNAPLFEHRQLYMHFRDDRVTRALKLITMKFDAVVLDPLPLREKYKFTNQLADFAAMYVAQASGTRVTSVSYRASLHLKATAAHALLALCALLLFNRQWSIDQASADFATLAALPSAVDGTEGNLMGLNPFHDYPAWEIIHEARRIADLRTDVRPVPEQLAELETSMRSAYTKWSGDSPLPPTQRPQRAK